MNPEVAEHTLERYAVAPGTGGEPYQSTLPLPAFLQEG